MNETSPFTSTTSAPAARKLRLGKGVLVALPLVAVAAAGFGLYHASGGGSAADSIPSAKVIRGDMRVSVTETGEIKAEKSKVILNDLRWPVVIEELAPEGSVVEKGQTIVRLSCQELEDGLIDQRLRAQESDDAYTSAVSNFEIKKLQKDARVRKADNALADAKADLEKYEQAEYPQQLDNSRGAIDVAEADLKLAEHKLQSKLAINADPELKQPYSQNEIDADRLNVERLKIAQSKAKTDRDILEKYTYPRVLRNRKSAVDDADLDLLTGKTERETELKIAKNLRDSAELNRNQQRDKLKQLEDDAKTKLHFVATEPGLVVYETRRRQWERPITVAIGEKVNPQQQLMILPDLSTLRVETRVYEAIREQVRDGPDGMPALIRLDAKRGVSLRGRVSRVAPLPDNQNPWLSPGVKVYPAFVELLDRPEGLKPGMTAEVEIVLAELEDVLHVPIAAVFSRDSQSFCYRVKPGGGYERVAVTVGQTSDTHAQILEGLREGETVLLVPPPGEQVETASLKKKEKEKEGEGAASRPAGAGANGGTERRGAREGQPDGQPSTGSAPARRGASGSGGNSGGGRRGGGGRSPM